MPSLRTDSIPVVLLGVCLVAGCGGDATGPDSRPTASQAAQVLVHQNGLPGAGALCVTPTAIDFGVAGARRVGETPIEAADAFAIGSLTKSMTATLAALLVQDGAIAWTSTIASVFPDLAGSIRAEYAAVTLLDLLAHRGRTYEPTALESLPPLSGTLSAQRSQFVAWSVQRAPTTPAGQTAYSNAGYVVAGAMLERASGQSWESLLATRLAYPLGMSVAFGVPGSGGVAEPHGHVLSGTQWVVADTAALDSLLPRFAYPAGGVKVGMQDLGRYLQLHLRALLGEGGLVLSPASARTLHTVIQDRLALGWLRLPRGAGTVDFHDGSDEASYYAEMALNEAARVACAVVVNAYSATAAQQVDVQLDRLLP